MIPVFKPDTKSLIDSLKGRKDLKIIFVCLGNICRSPAAHGMMESLVSEYPGLNWEIDSAGTAAYHAGDLPDKRMRLHARDRGLTLTHRARRIRPQDFYDFDLIIPMDSSNLQDLKELAPTAEAQKKIVPMAEFFSPGSRYDFVPDPYYEGSEGFELVLDLLEDSCSNLLEALR